jgi:hypothetical protein
MKTPFFDCPDPAFLTPAQEAKHRLGESCRRWPDREIKWTEPRVVTRFRRPSSWQFSLIAGEAPNTEARLEALIKLEVACRLALESLPRLPAGTQEALRKPIETLCEISGRELERLKPGVLDRGAGSS